MAGLDHFGFWSLDGQFWDSMEELQIIWADKCNGKKVMQEANLEKFLKDPLGYVDGLFDRGNGNFKDWEQQVIYGLHYKLLEQKISKVGEPSMIPCINDPELPKIKNGSVVTFRCMIQNVMPSGFWPHYVTIKDPVTGEATVKSTLLCDTFQNMEDMSDECGIVEKDVFAAITPPGESKWVSRVDFNGTSGLASLCKRMKLSEGEAGMVPVPNFKDIVPLMFQNHPDVKGIGCFLKLISNPMEIKPNDLVEVTGVICFEDLEDEEKKTRPSDSLDNISKFPVMHVFSCIKLAEGLPQLPIIEGQVFRLQETWKMEVKVAECASVLRELLALALGGDRYAAAFAMTALVARIMRRGVSPHGPLGKFVLNISGVSDKSDVVKDFEYILQEIAPRTLKLDVTTESLNRWKLTPEIANGEPSMLVPNLLQIANGTYVLLNETDLAEGALDETGTRNLGVLRELVEEQQVKYNYTYQFPAIPTEVPIVCLSTSPSILPTDTRIVLKPDPKLTPEERLSRIKHLLKEYSEKLRVYLGVARHINLKHYELFAEKSLQADFDAFFATRNQPRQGFISKLTPLEFNGFVTSCRYWCLLHGDFSITRERFNFWKEVELIRDSRFGPTPPAT